MPSKSTYPSRDQANARWLELARGIAASLDTVSEATLGHLPEQPGRLTVIGSGIGTMGFSRDAEAIILAADEVLFCVADAATEVWLRELRPDAYDLYVFYNDNKRRLHTYTQMSEAILHFVRQGRNVTAIFYGHPGIFVHSSHRAIEIARREGHEARMLPAVSALDWLCADLGVDPAYPGLQTFEATDLLLRARPVDLSMHVVLWQVGLIGQLGFRRRGYINNNFQLLVEYLIGYYGEDHTLTHYVAARYPTLDPTIERYRLEELRDRTLERKFTGISTFYIPPKQARPLDRAFAEAVGIIKPKQRLLPPKQQRSVAKYGPLEMTALRELTDFAVPPDYHFQHATGSARFLLALSNDAELRTLFRRDPKTALKDPRFATLTPRERQLLASREPGRIQLAAKGGVTDFSPTEKFVIALFSRASLAQAFTAEVGQVMTSPTVGADIDAWLAQNGFQGATIEDYNAALSNVSQSMLVAWTGTYVDSTGTVTLSVIGNAYGNAASAVMFNTQRVFKPAFAGGILTWSTADGNPNNGAFTFQAPPDGTTPDLNSAAGSVWISGTQPPPQYALTQAPLDTDTLGIWIGSYPTTITSGGSGAGPIVLVTPPAAGGSTPQLAIGGSPVAQYSYTGNTVTWGSGYTLTFATSSATPGQSTVTGSIGGQGVSGTSADDASVFAGEHATEIVANNIWTAADPLYFDGQSLTIGGNDISGFSYASKTLQWSGAGGTYDSGSLSFAVNPFTNQTGFYGSVWAAGDSKPTTQNFLGVANAGLSLSWSGLYATTLNSSAGPTLLIQNSATGQEVYLDGASAAVIIKGSVMKGVAGNSQFTITFTTSTSAPPAFSGTLNPGSGNQPWVSAALSNDISSWGDNYVTNILDTTNNNQKSGPSLGITVSGTGTSAVISVTLGLSSGAFNFTSAVYDPAQNAVYWDQVAGIPDANYANAALVFSRSGATKQFVGSYWLNGSKPPAASNWNGATTQQPSSPIWPYILFPTLCTALVGIFTFAYWKGWVRFSSRGARRLGNRTYEMVECQKEDMTRRRAAGAGLLAGGTCEEEEEELEEEQEGCESDAEEAGENAAEPADAEQGFDPYPDEPDVQVDAETETETETESESETESETESEVEVESETEVDAEVDAEVEVTVEELFFDEELESADAIRNDFVSGDDSEAEP